MGAGNKLISDSLYFLGRLKPKFSLLFFLIPLSSIILASGVQSTIFHTLSWPTIEDHPLSIDEENHIDLLCEYIDIMHIRRINKDPLNPDSVVSIGSRLWSSLRAKRSFGNKGIGITLEGIDLDIKTHFTDEYFTGFEGKQNRFIVGTDGWYKYGFLNTSISIQLPLYEFTTVMNPFWKRINFNASTAVTLKQFDIALNVKRYSPPSVRLTPFLSYTAFELPLHPSFCGVNVFTVYRQKIFKAELSGGIEWFRADSIRSKQHFFINSHGFNKTVHGSVSTQNIYKPFINIHVSSADIKTEALYGIKPFLGLDTLHASRLRMETGGKFFSNQLAISLYHDRLSIGTDSGVADAFPFSGWAALMNVAYRIDSAAARIRETGIKLDWLLKRKKYHATDIGLNFALVDINDTLIVREKQRLYLFFFTLGPYERYSSGGTEKLVLTPRIAHTWMPENRWLFKIGVTQHIPLDKPSFKATTTHGRKSSNIESSTRGGTIINFDVSRKL